LAGLPFIYALTKDDPWLEDDEDLFFPEMLAIASHHHKLANGVFGDYQKLRPNYEQAFFPDFYEMVNNEAARQNIPQWQPIKFDPAILDFTEKHNPYKLFKRNAVDRVENFGGDPLKRFLHRMRDLFVLFKGMLHQCDWLASSGKKPGDYAYQLPATKASVTEAMRSKENSKFEKWEDFQEAAAKAQGHIFVQIPTGQGKTEAALLWALNSEHPRKTLFLLPTMVTTNKTWERIKELNGGGDDLVGLSHSTASYVLEKELDIEPEQLRQQEFYNKTFFKAATVATVDQLIYSFFNWNRWVMTGATAYNANIIVDEVHAYDAYTFGLLLFCLQKAAQSGSRVAIMSATLPEIMRQKITEVLGESTSTLIREPRFGEKKRHKLEVWPEEISTLTQAIWGAYDQGQKVLVVCNTIKQARLVFDQLQGIEASNKMLYHSQFIIRDKKIKEDRLVNQIGKRPSKHKGGFVAVCTQIVEVSLDIDFDCMFTENAPIDALVQRLGRVNRKGQMAQLARVVICQENETARKYIYPPTLLDETRRLLEIECAGANQGEIPEKVFKQIVDQVYTELNLNRDRKYTEKLQNSLTYIEKLWQSSLKGIFTLSADERLLEQISSREMNYVTVECILLSHYQQNEIEEMLKKYQYNALREFTLKVPLYVAKASKTKILENGLYLLDIAYNETDGLLLKPDDQNML
jgi:CRISPR-associated endonuclease/helicase Cas3